MKKWFSLLALVIATLSVNAQVGKMVGQWYTIDDKTGEQRSCVSITENKGSYQAVIVAIYEKDAYGGYREMKPPYPKGWENVVGTQLFVDMTAEGEILRGKVYDPENQKTYHGKETYHAKTDELVLRGSLDKAGWLGRSQTWKRKR